MPRSFHDVEDPTRLRATLESLDVHVDERDRKRWVPAGGCGIEGATDGTFTNGGGPWGALLLPDASTSAVTASLPRPSTWINGSITTDFYLANAAAGTGNVVLVAFGIALAVAEAGTRTTTLSTTTASGAVGAVKVVSTTVPFTVASPDVWVGARLARVGADAADTLAGDLAFLGALITYNPA